ncbi:MAG TPA: peptidylprolyl isomerase [Vicinamibacterales bacterium]|jgi:cyclophilin family peptidyl-prolyl cis-trans isomerase/HEAT repeat protein|nr:peptidylprolyl isomerase [Vicinamibacterales bacterium]
MTRLRAAALFVIAAQAVLAAQQPSTPVVAAERAWAGADVLWPLTQTADPATTAAALRALGRLEDPALVPRILPFVDAADASVRSAASRAVAQSLQNAPGLPDPATLAAIVDALQRHVSVEDATGVASLGALTYSNADDVARVEGVLDRLLDDTIAGESLTALRGTTLSSFESLIRRNARVPGLRLQPETIARLEGAVQGLHANDGASERLYALLTMVQAGVVTPVAERAALTDSFDQVRRIAVKALAGTARAVGDDERTEALRRALDDPSALVRYEGVLAYAKAEAAAHGCLPLLQALQDTSPHVVNAALDALGTACVGDEDVNVRVAAESRAPAANGEWQREAHAFVALAKRDPDRARIVTSAFADSPIWQVRMYAARAATALKDDGTLARLATDANDNVREAALPPFRTLVKDRADAAVLDALKRSDPQLLRTAARIVKTMPPSHAIYRALADAFLRLTRERRETNRDARLALLDAIEIHGTRDDASDLARAAEDIDSVVATRVTALLTRWGRTAAAHPIPIVRGVAEWENVRQCVNVEMQNGRSFRLQMSTEAPVTANAFLTLALRDRLYNGLTFHRVEPNFVIQGGSPGANEYSSGLKTFLRDEIGLSNTRGAVGLSTRGRNTGDGQIYILLVDEPRLNGQYTIFAHVMDADMGVVDNVQEGDRIEQMTRTTCTRN